MDIYQSCVNAGPSRCPIYEHDATLVRARVNRLLDRLKSEPIPFYSNSSRFGSGYDLVDYALVKTFMFLALYNTHATGLFLAQALAALEQGDPSRFYQVSIRRTFDQLLQCTCPAPGETPPEFYGGSELTLAIACGDVLKNSSEDLDEIRKAYEEMARMSSFADTWAVRVLCSLVRDKRCFIVLHLTDIVQGLETSCEREIQR